MGQSRLEDLRETLLVLGQLRDLLERLDFTLEGFPDLAAIEATVIRERDRRQARGF